MSELPLGKIFLAILAICILLKTTVVLMWTAIVVLFAWLVKLMPGFSLRYPNK